MSGYNLVVIVTGSIAAAKGCEVISELVRRGHRVRAVATPSALRFVGPATLEGLTGQPVLSELFAGGAALEHIRLGRWADAVLVCPATAHLLNRLAAGLADDLAGAIFLAHDRAKPFLAVPAMNPAMWSHPATQASVARLRGWGVGILSPASGRTACGEEGEGRMPEPPVIAAWAEAEAARPARRLKVLVTSGGTSEPIDGVRVLTNVSTGRTGAGIADHLARRGHGVVLLRARRSAAPVAACRQEFFDSFQELDDGLARLLGGEAFDAVVHAAAVGDFGIEAIGVDGEERPPGGAKLDSDAAPVLRLRRHPKLVDSLRSRSRNPGIKVVAFKLTVSADDGEVRRSVDELLRRSGADLVVHNDLSARAGDDDFPSTLHPAGGAAPIPCPTRAGLAGALERLLAAPA